MSLLESEILLILETESLEPGFYLFAVKGMPISPEFISFYTHMDTDTRMVKCIQMPSYYSDCKVSGFSDSGSVRSLLRTICSYNIPFAC